MRSVPPAPRPLWSCRSHQSLERRGGPAPGHQQQQAGSSWWGRGLVVAEQWAGRGAGGQWESEEKASGWRVRNQGLRRGQAGEGLPQAALVQASPGALSDGGPGLPGKLCSHHPLYPWDPTAQVQPATKCRKNLPGGCSLHGASPRSTRSSVFVPAVVLGQALVAHLGTHPVSRVASPTHAPMRALRTCCPLVVWTSLCVPTGGSRFSCTELFSRKSHPMPASRRPRVGAREQGSGPPTPRSPPPGHPAQSGPQSGWVVGICQEHLGGLVPYRGVLVEGSTSLGWGWAGGRRLEAPTRPSKCSRLEAPHLPAHIPALNCDQYPEKQSILSVDVYWDKDSGEDYANTVRAGLCVQVPQIIHPPLSQLTAAATTILNHPGVASPRPASITFLLPPRAGGSSSVRTGVTVPQTPRLVIDATCFARAEPPSAHREA